MADLERLFSPSKREQYLDHGAGGILPEGTIRERVEVPILTPFPTEQFDQYFGQPETISRPCAFTTQKFGEEICRSLQENTEITDTPLGKLLNCLSHNPNDNPIQSIFRTACLKILSLEMAHQLALYLKDSNLLNLLKVNDSKNFCFAEEELRQVSEVFDRFKKYLLSSDRDTLFPESTTLLPRFTSTD